MALITLEREYKLCKRPGVHERFELYIPTTRWPDKCWRWKGARHKRSGYGRFHVAYLPETQGALSRFAHRVAWQLYCGPIPEGLGVFHRCDNPPCCNPAHLFVGTHADNMADMGRKGRAGRRQLSDEQVRAIRSRLLMPDRNISQITRDFRTHRKVVQGINSGTRYKHVPK